MSDSLTDPLQRLLAERCTPAAAQAIEQGGDSAPLWQVLEDSGYANALVPEAQGGAGLAVAQAGPLWFALGNAALPLPLAATMWARAEMAARGAVAPAGAITIAGAGCNSSAGGVRCAAVPLAAVSDWVAVPLAGEWVLWPAATAQRQCSGGHGSLHADCHWPQVPAAAIRWPMVGPALLPGALTTAAQMAGALQRVLEMTLQHANDREQFGKPIGRFQAVQQNLSVMAEHVAAARMAAEMACAGPAPSTLLVALAKARCGEAAALVVAAAHAVHGAMGVTQEHGLQRFTRALQAWRMDYGSAPYWHEQLGQALLQADGCAFDFLQQHLSPP